jgi:uncharacterized protein
LCVESCGPVPMSALEHARIRVRGVDIPVIDNALASIKQGVAPPCPALKDGRCTVYAVRPLLCRMWGAIETMPCPYGCTVTPGLLMDEGAKILFERSLKTGEGPHREC